MTKIYCVNMVYILARKGFTIVFTIIPTYNAIEQWFPITAQGTLSAPQKIKFWAKSRINLQNLNVFIQF